MKLEPVFLVAPMPEPKSMPTRRAWLVAGTAFVGGALAGASMAAWVHGEGADPQPRTPEDPTIAWLRKLCDDASPISELARHRVALLLNLPRSNQDPRLWHGVDRLVREVLAMDSLPDRRRLAMELVDFLAHAQLPADAAARWDLERLRSVARGN